VQQNEAKSTNTLLPIKDSVCFKVLACGRKNNTKIAFLIKCGSQVLNSHVPFRTCNSELLKHFSRCCSPYIKRKKILWGCKWINLKHFYSTSYSLKLRIYFKFIFFFNKAQTFRVIQVFTNCWFKQLLLNAS